MCVGVGVCVFEIVEEVNGVVSRGGAGVGGWGGWCVVRSGVVGTLLMVAL